MLRTSPPYEGLLSKKCRSLDVSEAHGSSRPLMSVASGYEGPYLLHCGCLYFVIKNGVFWDVTPCGSCKNRRFGGTWRFLHQGDKNR
jgi:hypothetical protein